MHQHPRPPPVTASPANSEQTNPTKTNNPRDRDSQTQGLGLSEDFASSRQNVSAPNSITEVSRLNQNFYTKAVLIILHSRVDLAPAYKKGSDIKRVNRWFNIELDETEEYEEDIRRWKVCDLRDGRPPPLIIETYLITEDLVPNQSLVVLDDQGKRWDVTEALALSYTSRTDKGRAPQEHEVILERWTVQLGEDGSPLPPDLTNILPLVYKGNIVLFRSLFIYNNFLPARKFSKAPGKVRPRGTLKLRYRIIDGTQMGLRGLQDNLTVPLFESKDKVVAEYAFGTIGSPAGPLSIGVAYRTACDFRVDDSEALLSSRFLGTDDEIFAPSLPTKDLIHHPRTKPIHNVSSLPSQTHHHIPYPDLGHAYGSLSTFHQVGPASGSSPISALRNVNDLFSDIPTSSPLPRPVPLQRSPQSSRPTLRAVEGAAGTARRPSISFQPFKTPSLSASPTIMSPLAGSPRTSLTRVPVLISPNEARGISLPMNPSSPVPKHGAQLPENAVTSSTSSSPKPAFITRYSDSFSHRRARMSSGGTNKTDEDQISSGKESAISSAQPGSGLLAEAGGGSSGSVHDNDENISGFLKMLDLKKDLLTPSNTASTEALTRRTTAALTHFHRMRNSNKELSDSMSSSLLLRARGSSRPSSRRLSSVLPTIPPTSILTSSSPGKPLSPHTPYTRAIPSWVNTASNIDYSYQDLGTQYRRLYNEQYESPPDAGLIKEPALEPSGGNVNTIPIPTSPRPFLPAYRRSSSVAQRRASPDVNDMIDLYGVRPASVGADGRLPRSRTPAAIAQDEPEARVMVGEFPLGSMDNRISDRPEISPRRSSLKTATSMLPPTNGAGLGLASGNSFTHNVYCSRPSRGGRARGTPPQGYSSSFGGGTVNRRVRPPSLSLPECKYEEDEPFLFAISDIRASRRSPEEAQAGANTARTVEKSSEADTGERGSDKHTRRVYASAESGSDSDAAGYFEVQQYDKLPRDRSTSPRRPSLKRTETSQSPSNEPRGRGFWRSDPGSPRQHRLRASSVYSNTSSRNSSLRGHDCFDAGYQQPTYSHPQVGSTSSAGSRYDIDRKSPGLPPVPRPSNPRYIVEPEDQDRRNRRSSIRLEELKLRQPSSTSSHEEDIGPAAQLPRPAKVPSPEPIPCKSPVPETENSKKGECNVCGLEIGINRKRDWQTHIFEDLRPYQCPEAGCQSASETYSTCTKLLAHMKEQHPNSELLTAKELACPFCQEELPGKRLQRLKHVGGHMEEIALSAITGALDEDWAFYSESEKYFSSVCGEEPQQDPLHLGTRLIGLSDGLITMS